MAVALVLLILPDAYRDSIARSLRATVLRPVVAVQRGGVDGGTRHLDVTVLRAERDSLASFLVSRSNLTAENRRLRRLLGFRERLARTYVAAEATRYWDPARAGQLLLPVGTEDGVREGQPVVTAEGLVGSVWRVGPRSAVAVDWTHPQFRASAMTTDGEVYGIIQPGETEAGERVLRLTPNAFHTEPDSGALIVTSGDGLTYPRGIPIGRVAGAGADEGGWQRVYYVRPLVNEVQSAHVLVLGEPTRAPSDRDLAAAWGIRLEGAPPADSARRVVSPDAAAPAAPRAASGAATTPERRPQTQPQRSTRDRGPRLLGEPVQRDTGGGGR